jgi:hypothetical protein
MRLIKTGQSEPFGLLYEVKTGSPRQRARSVSDVLVPGVDVHRKSPGFRSTSIRTSTSWTVASEKLDFREMPVRATSSDLYRPSSALLDFLLQNAAVD